MEKESRDNTILTKYVALIDAWYGSLSYGVGYGFAKTKYRRKKKRKERVRKRD